MIAGGRVTLCWAVAIWGDVGDLGGDTVVILILFGCAVFPFTMLGIENMYPMVRLFRQLGIDMSVRSYAIWRIYGILDPV